MNSTHLLLVFLLCSISLISCKKHRHEHMPITFGSPASVRKVEAADYQHQQHIFMQPTQQQLELDQAQANARQFDTEIVKPIGKVSVINQNCAIVQESQLVSGQIVTTSGECRNTGEPGQPFFCSLPGSTVSVAIELKNTGSNTWSPSDVSLVLSSSSVSTSFFAGIATSLLLTGSVAPGSSGVFANSFVAPKTTGMFVLEYQLNRACGVSDNSIYSVNLELTCSDKIFCNGVERFVNGKCVSALKQQCDDSSPCTFDYCDEELQYCTHKMNPLASSKCSRAAECVAGHGTKTRCKPSCSNSAKCGSNGCDGSCGQCSSGSVCQSGSCIDPATVSGTCANPVPLFTNNQFAVSRFTSNFDISGKPDSVNMTCNDDPDMFVPDIVYTFTVPNDGTRYSIDVRSYGAALDGNLDTMLQLFSGACPPSVPITHGGSQNAWCSDDSTPPGPYGSNLALFLSGGTTYYLVVSGYLSTDVGAGILDVRVQAEYVPTCMNKQCGPDGGPNNSSDCGPCPSSLTCNDILQCVAAPSSSFCTKSRCDRGKRKCGDDGCGGSCGSCNSAIGELCVPATGQCQVFASCDHHRPVCSGCTSTQYCGNDCQCHDISAVVPDLAIGKQQMLESIAFETRNFNEYSCAFSEQCLGGLGPRRLLRFDTWVMNQGFVDLILPAPASNPNEFFWARCHNHYHYNGFSEYRLLSADGSKVVASGHKQAFCLMDIIDLRSYGQVGPEVPCAGSRDCTNPGVTRGWADIYDASLDCQWVDITGIEPGNYKLRVELNVKRAIPEASYENNILTIDVTIPAEDNFF